MFFFCFFASLHPGRKQRTVVLAAQLPIDGKLLGKLINIESVPGDTEPVHAVLLRFHKGIQFFPYVVGWRSLCAAPTPNTQQGCYGYNNPILHLAQIFRYTYLLPFAGGHPCRGYAGYNC